MLQGWIIYEREAAERNSKYIGWYIDKFKARQIDMKLVYTDEARELPLPDFAIVRAIAPDITGYLEINGVRCYNKHFVASLTNDKLETYRYISKRGIEIMRVFESPGDIDKYPVVLKPRNSHGGDRVFMVNSYEELLSKLPLYPNGNFLIQKPASDLGKDLRVYVVGGRIVCAMLRQSDTDFRSNFCLGGKASPYELSNEEIELVERIIPFFELDFGGIDFVFNDGRIVFNEVEDVVGSRMVYTYTDIDIVQEYVNYIVKTVRSEIFRYSVYRNH